MTVVNPDSVGNPDETPRVKLPTPFVDWFERTRCQECGQINRTHAADCITKGAGK